jgi:hypothetical protein
MVISLLTCLCPSADDFFSLWSYYDNIFAVIWTKRRRGLASGWLAIVSTVVVNWQLVKNAAAGQGQPVRRLAAQAALLSRRQPDLPRRKVQPDQVRPARPGRRPAAVLLRSGRVSEHLPAEGRSPAVKPAPDLRTIWRLWPASLNIFDI